MNACSYCCGDHLAFADAFNKDQLIEIMSIISNEVIFEGSIPILQILSKLGSDPIKKRLYGSDFSKKKRGKLHGLVLQPIASRIIVLKCSGTNLLWSESLNKNNVMLVQMDCSDTRTRHMTGIYTTHIISYHSMHTIISYSLNIKINLRFVGVSATVCYSIL